MDGKEKIFGEFVSYDLLETEEGYCVVFYEKYDDTIVFSNYFRVFVSQAGIYQVQFIYCPVVGYNGEKKDIFYAMKHCSHSCGNCGKTSRKGL